MADEFVWSDWLDFNEETISKIPPSAGIYMMHAAMKILYIGGSANLKESILKSLNAPCTRDSKRFKYAVLSDFERVGVQLLREYQEKHNGKLPKCME
ncbi:MAG: hypothetical protein QXN55_04460 [Candidatus Nitrosotenuis sp.]|jgi:hypothetical protein